MKKIFLLFPLMMTCFISYSQEMTMLEAITVARYSSVQALEAKQSFISTYWAWKAYQASRLPSLYLYGNIGNFNRSLSLLQSPGDGSLHYVSSYNMQNGIGIQARQNITFTGGTLSIYTDINRIDQFGGNAAVTWYTQPITISYEQPLFAYNKFKWDKLIEPKEYEKGRRKYLESMEQVSLNVVRAWFNLLKAMQNEETAHLNFDNTLSMRDVAAQRLALGTITRDDYLQLELRALNDSIAINECAILVRETMMELNSLLGYDESTEIIPILEDDLPETIVDYDLVLEKVYANSSFLLDNDIKLLKARSEVAKANAQRGVTMSFNARFGLSKSGPSFLETYKRPLDQEVFGLSFSLPIFDWGQARGRIEKAKAAEEVSKAQVEQDENAFRRKVFTAVGQFNNQRRQCAVSRRASTIATERYSLVMDKFREGSATVIELNTARAESDTANVQYITDLGKYWIYYYNLRLFSLFDVFTGEDILINEDELTTN